MVNPFDCTCLTGFLYRRKRIDKSNSNDSRHFITETNAGEKRPKQSRKQQTTIQLLDKTTATPTTTTTTTTLNGVWEKLAADNDRSRHERGIGYHKKRGSGVQEKRKKLLAAFKQTYLLWLNYTTI